MKILIFSTAYFPHVGGAEVAVKDITDRIRDVNFDMITVRLDKKDKTREKIGNINVHRLGWGLGRIDKLLFPFRAARLANKLHKKNNYSIAWSVMASFSGFAALFFTKKNPQVKFLLTLQEGDDLQEPVRKSFLVNFWFKQIFTTADYIQCISSYLAQWAKQMGAKCPVSVVPNGVSHTPYNMADTLADNWGLDKSAKIILTTSRLVKKNGVGDLIKAVSILTKKYNQNIILIICGVGELEKELKNLAKDLKVEDKIKFTGFIVPTKLPQYYSQADVFCRPSLSEGLGNSFLEAMSYDVPVVATKIGGIKDFLEHKKTGFVCEVNNPDSIAKQINYVLDEKNKNEVKAVVDNAKQMVEKKYSWDNISKNMKTIFNKLT